MPQFVINCDWNVLSSRRLELRRPLSQPPTTPILMSLSETTKSSAAQACSSFYLCCFYARQAALSVLSWCTKGVSRSCRKRIPVAIWLLESLILQGWLSKCWSSFNLGQPPGELLDGSSYLLGCMWEGRLIYALHPRRQAKYKSNGVWQMRVLLLQTFPKRNWKVSISVRHYDSWRNALGMNLRSLRG